MIRILIVIASIYLILIISFLAKYNFNSSALILFSEDYVSYFNLDQRATDFVVHKGNQGFDGSFYYLISLRLLGADVKVSAYRYQRILYPLVSSILAFGKKEYLPQVLIMTNIFLIVLVSFLFLKLCNKYESNLNLGYIFAFNIGFVICTLRDLSEPLMILFILASVYSYLKDNKLAFCTFLILALLTKENTLSIIIVPALFYFGFKRKFQYFIISLIPVGCFIFWQVFIYQFFNDSGVDKSFHQAIGFFSPNKYTILTSPNSFKDYLYNFSALPVIFFVIVQALLIVKKKDRNLTLFSTILIFQLMHMLLFINYRIDDIGRYALGLFLFSLLFYMERGENYPNILKGIICITTLIYLFTKMFIFQPDFYIL